MSKFFNTITAFFKAPVFEDQEKTDKAFLLNFITMAYFTVVTLASSLSLLTATDFAASISALLVRVAPLLFILVVAQVLMRRGRVTEASLFFAVSHWLNVTYGIVLTGGVSSASLPNYVLSVLIFGLLLGNIYAVTVAITSFISAVVMMVLGARGVIVGTPVAAATQGFTALLTFATFLYLGTSLLYLYLRRLSETLKALEESRAGLEQRVVERTKELQDLQDVFSKRASELQAVAEISTNAAQSTNLQDMLQTVVEGTKSGYNLYHAHIYLMDESKSKLVLTAGAGDAGRQMVSEKRTIALDHTHSLVARAARTNKGAISNDVTKEPDFLPNPLLPFTKAEMAIPIAVGDNVLGVLDVQADYINRFNDEDIAIKTTLAQQIATSIQNIQAYAETQRSQEQLSEALDISRLANWEYDVYQDIFTFNDKFYSIFRTSIEKVGSYKLSAADYTRLFVHPEDAPLVGSEIQKILESKEMHISTSLEHRIIFSDGQVGYISIKVNVDRDENGKIIRWRGANQDITERRQLEELNRRRARQQEAINLISQKIQSSSTIETAMQVAARELGNALGKRQTLVALEPSVLGGNGRSDKSE